MAMIVIMPGGFHPFHAGHFALYQSALKAFPGAEVYVAATNDMSERPFPFALKEKLAKLAGVKPGHFVQVKSPFKSEEITKNYDPEKDVLVFVRSEKDKDESPKPGGIKKDGTPAYFQPWTGKNVQPFAKHAYFAYLPTVEFGPGITSATQIRKAWPTLNDKRKTALVMSLYPAAQKNPKLAQNVVGMFDQVMGEQVSEDKSKAIDSVAKSLVNPPKIMKHRAQRDKEREEQLKYRDIAKRTDEGFGPGYPETYEQENKPFKHKGQYRITDITSEDVNEEHVYRGNAPGEAVRTHKPKRVPNQNELNRKKGVLPESIDYLDEI